VIVATGQAPANNAIWESCYIEGWHCYRGSDDDVLDRFYNAALAVKADAIVRISGDSPLIDPDVIDECVRQLRIGHYQYVTNTMPPTWPDGEDTEVFTIDALGVAWLNARKPSEREHVTPWLRAHLPTSKTHNLVHSPDLSAYRLCVDTLEDLVVMRQIMEIAGSDCDWHQAVDVLDGHPEITILNQSLDRDAAYLAQLKEEQHGQFRSAAQTNAT